MFRLMRRDELVGCVLFASTGVADDRFNDPLGLIERRLHAPETAAAENGSFRLTVSRDGEAGEAEGENDKAFMHYPKLRALPEISYSTELIPVDYFAPLDLAQIFGRVAPLEVDLGCGDGAFLVALAEQFPERNFLGMERLRGRARSACGKAERKRLRNVRVLRVESSYALEYLLPPESVDVVHLLFPDPWPKRRHHRRRVVTNNFLAAVHRVLAPDGRFRVATDQDDYFRSIRRLMSPALFVEENGKRAAPVESRTTFEKHFIATGAPIYRLELAKVS